MSEDKPQDPFTQFQEGAAGLHEAYMAYQEAGFASHEALYLVGQMLVAAVQRPPSAP